MSKTSIALLVAICLPVIAFAEVRTADPCAVLDAVKIHSTKMEAIEAVGAPYNQQFTMRPEGKKVQYQFELHKEQFIELFLDFNEEGLLVDKALAGAECLTEE